MNVWKFQLNLLTVHQQVTMPQGAKLLCVQQQYESVALWAAVHPENKLVARTIAVRCTGDSFTEPLINYVGTVQLQRGSLVLHVFDGGEVE